MKIAIIDLHPILRAGLKVFLREKFQKPALLDAADIELFHKLYPAEELDLIIMTVGQAKHPGNLTQIKLAKTYYPKAKLIISDENPEFYMIGKYLALNANGYIAKQCAIKDLTECIRDVLDGKQYICRMVFDTVVNDTAWIADNPLPKTAKGKKRITLSPRQEEIAGFLIQGKKTSEIAKMLGRSPSTISTTKGKIMEKYHVDNILQLRTAINGK